MTAPASSSFAWFKNLLRWVVGVPLLFLVVAFVASNPQMVEVNLWPLPYATSFSLSLLIVLMVVIGYALGRLLGWAELRRWRKENKRLRRQLDQPPGSKW